MIPPLWCPPRTRWSCCFHSPSRPMPEETWCWAANDRAWGGKRKRFHHLAPQRLSTKTSHLSALHLLPLRAESTEASEKEKDLGCEMGEKRGVSIEKPASCSLRFSCPCRSNMMVDYTVLAGRHYKKNKSCPSEPAVLISVCRVAVHGAD